MGEDVALEGGEVAELAVLFVPLPRLAFAEDIRVSASNCHGRAVGSDRHLPPPHDVFRGTGARTGARRCRRRPNRLEQVSRARSRRSLENRYPSLGGSRVQIPPPPL